MKRSTILLAAFLVFGMLAFAYAKNIFAEDPWKTTDLLAPKILSETINNPKAEKPVIFNIGPSGAIKGSVEIGSTQDEENMAKLKAELGKLPENKAVVIYCGCCPYAKCPNIRPAFSLLKEMSFTNGKLLDLPQNLKTDWINYGYPMQVE